MTDKKELHFLLALQRASGVGDLSARKLIAACGSAEAIFMEKPHVLRRIEGVSSRMVETVLAKDNLLEAEREMRWLENNNIRVLPFSDREYPHRLRHCVDGPLILFLEGNIDLNAARFISVVGTRKLTPEGRSFCEKFIAELAPLSPTIVSGYAYGADICAHLSALEHNLQTIACMAHGLHTTYPGVHRKYNSRIMEKGGFITDFWSDEGPERDHFLRRNRIIAGLSEAVVVIESAEKGGSLVTADIANSYNREVFAVPGKPGDMFSKGCNSLIKRQEAHLLESAADLAFMLGWNPEEKSPAPAVQKQLFVELEPDEEVVFSKLSDGGKMLLDEIAYTCNLPVHKLSATLVGMEMKGVVRPLPGKYFELV